MRAHDLRFRSTSAYDKVVDGLVLVGGLHKRLGFNFNKYVLVLSVFLSLPGSLQHHHFSVFAPSGSTVTLRLVTGSHHKCHK